MSALPPEQNLALKQNLTRVVNHPETQGLILNLVHLTHRINIHARQFLKLFLLNKYDTVKRLPTISEHFVLNIMKVLCAKGSVGTRGKLETLALHKELGQRHWVA